MIAHGDAAWKAFARRLVLRRRLELTQGLHALLRQWPVKRPREQTPNHPVEDRIVEAAAGTLHPMMAPTER